MATLPPENFRLPAEDETHLHVGSAVRRSVKRYRERRVKFSVSRSPISDALISRRLSPARDRGKRGGSQRRSAAGRGGRSRP